MSTSTTTATEDRALSLLGQGLGVEIVANAVGVSPSRISQLLSEPEFASRVAELRYANLVKHSAIDAKYDEMESELQARMKDLIPFMMKPLEVMKALQVINAAKRRGASAPEAITAQQNVVQLVMPTQIINNFTQQAITVNVNNQVVKAGEQELVTVQSANMTKMLEASQALTKKLENSKENHYVPSISQST